MRRALFGLTADGPSTGHEAATAASGMSLLNDADRHEPILGITEIQFRLP